MISCRKLPASRPRGSSSAGGAARASADTWAASLASSPAASSVSAGTKRWCARRIAEYDVTMKPARAVAAW